MEIIQNIFTITHITAAIATLSSGLGAVLSKAFNAEHRIHMLCGRIFFWSMFVIFVTAVPMAIFASSIFLLLIAIFSFYLALSGWCYARNRKGIAWRLDWIRSLGMLAVSIIMAVYGFWLLLSGDTMGYTMLVFSVIGLALSVKDLRIILTGGVTGSDRIANHLTMMLAASIAAITAFSVVNISIEPAYVVWLAPTVLITPIIVVWNIKVRNDSGRNGITKNPA